TATAGTLVDGAGGTVVANGASLELAGGLTISGEPLVLQGQGTAATSNVPPGWFYEGPAPVNNGQTPGTQAVTGRVTRVVAAPNDPTVLFGGTGGGGVWKTTNGGLTWLPLFDLQNGSPEVQQVALQNTTGTFTLTFTDQNGRSDTTPPLPAGATAQQVQT